MLSWKRKLRFHAGCWSIFPLQCFIILSSSRPRIISVTILSQYIVSGRCHHHCQHRSHIYQSVLACAINERMSGFTLARQMFVTRVFSVGIARMLGFRPPIAVFNPLVGLTYSYVNSFCQHNVGLHRPTRPTWCYTVFTAVCFKPR